MPLDLKPPRPGKSPNWTIRGTYLRVGIDQSSGTPDKAAARKKLKEIERDIECGVYSTEPLAPTEAASDKPELTFADAVVVYLEAGGEGRFVKKLMAHFGATLIKDIDNAAANAAAVAICPAGTAATRNRNVLTPIRAIRGAVGDERSLKRPKGSQGNSRTVWLWPEQAAAVFAAAAEIDTELAILAVMLCYCGTRLGETLNLPCKEIRLSESFAYIGKSKNGDPRPVYLPPIVVSALTGHPRGLDRAERLFRWTRCGLLYVLIERAFASAGVDHKGAPFHIFRHTYGTWMRRYGGLDEIGLVGTGAWKDPKSVKRYAHTVVSEDARRADLLPTETEIRGKSVETAADKIKYNKINSIKI